MNRARAWSDAERRLHAIVDTAADAIITIDQRGIIESVNPATERLFGYQRDELPGQNVHILMPAPQRRQHDGHIQHYLATGEARIIGSSREVVGRRKSGTTLPLRLSISEWSLDGKRMFTAILHDITERRRLEQQIVDAGQNEQRRIGQELHDGVCQNLIGAALRLNVLAKTVAVTSPVAAAEAQQLADFIRRTATEARELSHGLVPIEIAEGGLRPALVALASHLEELFAVKCGIHVSDEQLPFNTTTSTHLYRIAQEAASNSIRHGKARRVEIRLSRVGSTWTLTIQDDGSGFATKPGMGMGIQTMSYRARVIGGALAISQARERGTLVSCCFPSPV